MLNQVLIKQRSSPSCVSSIFSILRNILLFLPLRVSVLWQTTSIIPIQIYRSTAPSCQPASFTVGVDRFANVTQNLRETFFLATFVKIRDDKELLSDFKVLLDVEFASGAARVRRILPTMAVLVRICNVFPGLRMGLDSVLAFQGQVLDSSAVFGHAGPLLTVRKAHLHADALGLLLYYRSCQDIICFP